MLIAVWLTLVFLLLMVLPPKLSSFYRIYSVYRAQKHPDVIDRLETLIESNRRMFKFYIWLTHLLRAILFKFGADFFWQEAQLRQDAITRLENSIEQIKIERDQPFLQIESIDLD